MIGNITSKCQCSHVGGSGMACFWKIHVKSVLRWRLCFLWTPDDWNKPLLLYLPFAWDESFSCYTRKRQIRQERSLIINHILTHCTVRKRSMRLICYLIKIPGLLIVVYLKFHISNQSIYICMLSRNITHWQQRQRHLECHNKCCSFELSIHQRILKKVYHVFHKNMNQHNCY